MVEYAWSKLKSKEWESKEVTFPCFFIKEYHEMFLDKNDIKRKVEEKIKKERSKIDRIENNLKLLYEIKNNINYFKDLKDNFYNKLINKDIYNLYKNSEVYEKIKKYTLEYSKILKRKHFRKIYLDDICIKVNKIIKKNN